MRGPNAPRDLGSLLSRIRQQPAAALQQIFYLQAALTPPAMAPISATRAVATIEPMPGIFSNRRLASHDRRQATILRSIDPISAPMALY
jgi:hypothetical protein